MRAYPFIGEKEAVCKAGAVHSYQDVRVSGYEHLFSDIHSHQVYHLHLFMERR